MDIRQIEAFVAVATFRSFNTAAARLRVTQPAISTRIRLLEEELGAALFDRRSKKVSLTPRAIELLGYAESILEACRKMRSAPDSISHLTGRVRVGVPGPLARLWVPRVIRLLGARWPQLKVEIHIDRPPALGGLLANGELDVAILLNIREDEMLRCLPLVRCSYIWAASSSLEMPKRKISMRELATYPIATYSKSSAPSPVLEAQLHASDVESLQFYRCNSSDAILSIVLSGIAIGYIIDAAVTPEIKNGTVNVIDVDAEKNTVQYFICYNDDMSSNIGRLVVEEIAKYNSA